MSPRTSNLLIVLTTLLFSTLARAQAPIQPDENLWSTLIPDLANDPAPGWVKPGCQMAHEYITATVPGSFDDYSADNTGEFHHKTAGRFRPTTGSAHGYILATVAAIQDNLAICQLRVSMFANEQTLIPSMDIPSIVPVGANNAWLSADALKRLASLQGQGFTIAHGPYTIAGKTFQALWIMYSTTSAYNYWLYDENSGILLRQGTASPGPSSGGPTTVLAILTFTQARNLQLPWLSSPPPNWLTTFHFLQFTGNMTTRIPYSPAFSQPIQRSIQPKRRGNASVEFSIHDWMGFPSGVPPQTSDSADLSGLGTLAGLFIPPAAIPNLQQGQVLDTDPVTHFTTTVAGFSRSTSGRPTVVLRETGPAHTIDSAYDTATGVLLSTTRTDQFPADMTRRLDLSQSH